VMRSVSKNELSAYAEVEGAEKCLN
jgi:hypothetical protein